MGVHNVLQLQLTVACLCEGWKGECVGWSAHVWQGLGRCGLRSIFATLHRYGIQGGWTEEAGVWGAKLTQVLGASGRTGGAGAGGSDRSPRLRFGKGSRDCPGWLLVRRLWGRLAG